MYNKIHVHDGAIDSVAEWSRVGALPVAHRGARFEVYLTAATGRHARRITAAPPRWVQIHAFVSRFREGTLRRDAYSTHTARQARPGWLPRLAQQLAWVV